MQIRGAPVAKGFIEATSGTAIKRAASAPDP
jgi:hypothetical protein